MLRLCFILVLPFLLLAKEVNIAVNAPLGLETATREWTPTLNYLQEKFPQYTFNLLPFQPDNVSELQELVFKEKIDFVITQPAIYIQLELNLGMSRILTMTKENGISEFGSVFVVRDDSDIQTINDIKDKKISAVAPLGFGGWLIGYNELLKKEIDPLQDKMVSFPGTQINVINDVIQKKSSVGVIRTGMLEKLEEKGFSDLQKLRVVNVKKKKDFPYHLSTDLYPEWTLAKARHTSNELAKEIAMAFLSIQKDSDIAKSAHYESWTFPYNYQPVHDLMKSLRVGVYENHGTVSFEEVVDKYKYYLLLLALLFISLVLFLLYSRHINAKLFYEKLLKSSALEHLETVFDIQVSLLFIIKDNEIVKMNKAFMNFFKVESKSEFMQKQKKIEEYFEDVGDERYWHFSDNNENWIETLLNKKDDHIKVKIFNTIFLLNIRQFPSEENSYVCMLSDITYMEDSNAYLEAQIDIAKDSIIEKEKELNRQSKRAAMGDMISVIAHQLKQPLGVMSILHTKILVSLQMDMFTKDDVLEKITTANKHIDIMSTTIDDFRDFFKPDKKIKSFLVRHCFTTVLDLLSPVLEKNKITVKFDGGKNISVLSIENELFHVLLNLINNAKDVLVAREIENPEISISIKRDGELCTITIEDNAGGIDDTVIDKIFEPYFTTKKDFGTGIGLNLSQMIIEESLGGLLSVKNGELGAKFKIVL